MCRGNYILKLFVKISFVKFFFFVDSQQFYDAKISSYTVFKANDYEIGVLAVITLLVLRTLMWGGVFCPMSVLKTVNVILARTPIS